MHKGDNGDYLHATAAPLEDTNLPHGVAVTSSQHQVFVERPLWTTEGSGFQI